ncbi:MAG: succinate dehydrogenase cytochrome b subunit [Gemmatimonadetes bacterium]|jgi:succinate dehydrogenase / fumarate reductase cytochrome b subunit|nr:succinate dehydrogenase cytochrome b subunit [Gemmatimonadota bacterium]MBP6670027.1 succinate dehydrogenase cytochrome b subunit [Gemmatimonadales bacterium]MBK6779055.1 succinate dehydrogenase cytochrome b subunit [Gemmatimonadota bacterium]MBK7348633.1 succinate dehydrogenase cytochrome b subunit [Gemmatimonadota bacterium]MBK7714198.1 succinate dehydrogenase cytochrome b subunit [Gemmatimonadota bacterium]
MDRFRVYFRSTVGRKAIMGITGTILALFAVQHVLGNLLIYQSSINLNRYALFLKDKPGILWPARIVLLVSVLLHIVTALQLILRSRAARPVPYARQVPQASTLAGRTIRFSGAFLLFFIVFHILHLTTGTILPETHLPMDVFGNVVRGFRVWWVSAIYLVAMICLALHLYHGLWASPRTLGLEPPYAPKHQPLPQIVALLVWLGFTSIPVAVLLGYLHQ